MSIGQQQSNEDTCAAGMCACAGAREGAGLCRCERTSAGKYGGEGAGTGEGLCPCERTGAGKGACGCAGESEEDGGTPRGTPGGQSAYAPPSGRKGSKWWARMVDAFIDWL